MLKFYSIFSHLVKSVITVENDRVKIVAYVAASHYNIIPPWDILFILMHL